MTRSFHAVRLGAALAAAVLAGSCAKTPTAPTPVPVVTPPVITCPASQSLTSAQATPIPVVYSSPSVAGGASPITTACTPASGSTFPLGTTTVTCTATDAQQRSSSCTLTVAVAAPPRIRLTKFVAFGDSITWGEDGTYALTTEINGVMRFVQSVLLSGRQYPTVLLAELQGRYSLQTSTITVANAGCPGETVGVNEAACEQPLPPLQRFNAAIANQQAVLLMEGSNDVNAAVRDSAAIDAALGNLLRMVRAAKTAGVVPYLATIAPMNPNSACIPICRGQGAALVPGYNDRIRTLALQEGVTLVDVNKAFNGDFSLLSTDGLHPNAAGYQRIADTFFDSLKSTLEQATTLTSGTPLFVPLPTD
ncbi:MAG: SGNH/GDSL hydrolase family protein [Vicinamibacterales bacterium]